MLVFALSCLQLGRPITDLHNQLLILDDAVGCDTRTSIHTSEKGVRKSCDMQTYR